MPKPLPVGRELRQSTRCSPVANWWRQQQIHLWSSWWVLFLHFRSTHFTCDRSLLKRTTHELHFRMSVFSRSWLSWGRNPTMQNQHSALDFYFWRRKFMHRNAQKNRPKDVQQKSGGKDPSFYADIFPVPFPQTIRRIVVFWDGYFTTVQSKPTAFTG